MQISNIKKSGIRFLHRIGKSTLNQGITVPIDCQDQWMLKISKGQCVSVVMRFESEELDVDLRRINNVKGHLQFRYERQEHQPLRDYFMRLSKTYQPKNACVVEIRETRRGAFQIIPVAGFQNDKARLSIYQPVCHLFGERKLSNSPEFREVVEAISNIDFIPNHTQRQYNLSIQNELRKRNWLTEQSVHDDIGLKCDFRKCDIWMEVEFGNARTYYQNYIKFLIAAKFRGYDYGILLCPTASFASYLCDLGKERARLKGHRTARASYSGMMTYEKALRELPCLEHIISQRVVIAGLDVQIYPTFL